MSAPDKHRLAGLSILLELGKRAREAASAAELGFVVVNETRQLVDYRQSALWFSEGGVRAVSGLPDADTNTPYGQWLGELCAAELSRETGGQPYTLIARRVSDELAEDWPDWMPSNVLVLPFVGPAEGIGHDRLNGLWLLGRDEDWNAAEIDLLRELASMYAHAWRQFRPNQHWRQRVKRFISKLQHRRKLAVGIVVMVLLPVRLTVLAPAEVVPKDAFPVRVPLEGVIDRVHVSPNQPVAANHPLFDLDTTSLRARFGIASKAFEAAAEEYRQAAQLAVSNDEKGRLEMTQRKGRMEEKATELAYSEQLLARVHIRAPRAGVAVFTDANELIGRGVSIGERIMQIADPTKVEIAIRLPVGDAIELGPHAEVTLYLTTAPQYSYSATVSYAAYRPEPTGDGIVAYRMKADFVPGETPPRLGLTGTAKLYGNWVPISYYVLRRPLAALRQWVGW